MTVSSWMKTATWSKGSENDSLASHAFGSRASRSWIWSGTTGRLWNRDEADHEGHKPQDTVGGGGRLTYRFRSSPVAERSRGEMAEALCGRCVVAGTRVLDGGVASEVRRRVEKRLG